MYRIDDASAAATLPTPEAAGTEGYWTEGNLLTNVPATLERASWFNMVQEELRAVVVAGGLTPSKTTYNQVITAIANLIHAFSTPYQNYLGVSINLNNTALFFDGPIVSQGSTGTWFVSGSVNLYNNDAAMGIYVVYLWDGTNLIATSRLDLASGDRKTVSLSGIISSPAGNLRFSVRGYSNTNGQILFDSFGSGHGSTISAFRIG